MDLKGDAGNFCISLFWSQYRNTYTYEKDRIKTVAHNTVNADEFKVAMKCGPKDYHFIRLDSGGWYNKSGTTTGLFVDQSVVTAEQWYGLSMEDYGTKTWWGTYYDDETIYFAVKVGWDAQ